MDGLISLVLQAFGILAQYNGETQCSLTFPVNTKFQRQHHQVKIQRDKYLSFIMVAAVDKKHRNKKNESIGMKL